MAKKRTTSVKQSKQRQYNVKNGTGYRGNGNPDKIKGQGFHTNPERINRKGRPPTLYNDINRQLESEGYKPMGYAEYIDTIGRLIQLDEKRIKALLVDPKTPYSLRLRIKILSGPRAMEALRDLDDRMFGKARQVIESEHHLSGNINHLHKIQDIPLDELSEQAKELVFEITKKQLTISNREN